MFFEEKNHRGIRNQKLGKSQEFSGMGCLKIFLVKGKKPQGGVQLPRWFRGLRLSYSQPFTLPVKTVPVVAPAHYGRGDQELGGEAEDGVAQAKPTGAPRLVAVREHPETRRKNE